MAISICPLCWLSPGSTTEPTYGIPNTKALTIMYGTVVRKVCSDISQRTEPSRVSVLFVRISKNYKHMCCKYAFAAV